MGTVGGGRLAWSSPVGVWACGRSRFGSHEEHRVGGTPATIRGQLSHPGAMTARHRGRRPEGSGKRERDKDRETDRQRDKDGR